MLEATQGVWNVSSRCLVHLGELLAAFFSVAPDSNYVHLTRLLALRLHSSIGQSLQNAMTAAGAWRRTC